MIGGNHRRNNYVLTVVSINLTSTMFESLIVTSLKVMKKCEMKFDDFRFYQTNIKNMYIFFFENIQDVKFSNN